nr:hypothetical protein [Brevundimonas diminuta]
MSGGVRTALDQAMEADDGMAEVVQAGLFEELEPSETGDLTAPSPLSAALPSVRRKPGRPRGSKNRRTEAVTAWLLTFNRNPLQVMMEAYGMTPVELASRIGLQKATKTIKEKREVAGGIVEVEVETQLDYFSNDVLMDLFKLQMRMAEVCAPYVAQKLPQAVQVEGGAALTVNFGGVHLGAGGVSSPARGEAPEISVGGGMAVRLGQVGRDQSDGDLGD